MVDVNVAVIGAGPGGLQAGLYTASEGLSTVLFEADKVGGQIRQTPLLENFVGQSPNGVIGEPFAEIMRSQVEALGGKFLPGSVIDLKTDKKSGIKTITYRNHGDNREHTMTAEAVIIASGTRWYPTKIPGAAEITGSFLHYGPYKTQLVEKGQEYIVVGGGNSSAQGIVELAYHARKVHVIIRSEWKCSQYLVDRINAALNVQLYLATECDKITSHDNGFLMHAHNADGEQLVMPFNHCFFCANQVPNTGFCRKVVKQDEYGYIIVGGRNREQHETNLKGVFAIGDARVNTNRRSVANAIGDASNVASELHRYFNVLNGVNLAPTSIS